MPGHLFLIHGFEISELLIWQQLTLMIETLTIATLSILFLVFFRSGKTAPLENRLLINRPGKYQITLAPKLNLAQSFIEAVAERIGTNGHAVDGSAMLFFQVQDKQVVAHGYDSYLLAVIYRNGLLYFQAEYPSLKMPSDNLDIIKAFTIDVLLDFPSRDKYTETLEAEIAYAMQTVALARGVSVNLLAD